MPIFKSHGNWTPDKSMVIAFLTFPPDLSTKAHFFQISRIESLPFPTYKHSQQVILFTLTTNAEKVYNKILATPSYQDMKGSHSAIRTAREEEALLAGIDAGVDDDLLPTEGSPAGSPARVRLFPEPPDHSKVATSLNYKEKEFWSGTEVAIDF